MFIDCDGCAMRDLACSDCVVTVLLGAPAEGPQLDDTDQRALAALAEGGLIPPLRLVPVSQSGDDVSHKAAESERNITKRQRRTG